MKYYLSMEKASESVSIRFEEKDKKELEKAAEHEGRTFVGLIRHIAHEWLKKYRRRVK